MKPDPAGPAEAESHAIAIVGTGFAGLGMAIRLKQAGIEDFVVLEKANEVGGTWRDNHYPGCACDVQSHLYSFSFEPNPEWTRMFAPQPEILRYLRHCAHKYGVTPHVRFGRQVVGARFDETRGLWQVETADAQEVAIYMQRHGLRPGAAFPENDPQQPPRTRFAVRALVLGTGGLSTPAYPDIPGLKSFQGRSFHSQDWDHGYDFKGKRVAVIGTGASAIQFVPQLQKQVARLDLYQRTPPWIIDKPDRAITRLERALFRVLPATQRLFRSAIWAMLETRVLGFAVHPRLMKLVQREALAHIRRQIRDPQLRARLTPDYTIGCKRILISGDYYPALDQPNVQVLAQGIREVRGHSLVDNDGVERPVDCIVFGTGFRALDPLPHGVYFGRGGHDIAQVWKDGPEAYKGTTVAGFPNLFMLPGPNTGLGHSSMVYMIEAQIAYVLDALRLMRAQRLATVEPRPEAQARYNAGLQQRLRRAIWSVGGCQSWYLHPSGKNVTLWPTFTFVFRRLLRRFDRENYVLTAQLPQAATAGTGPLAATALPAMAPDNGLH